MLLRPRLVLRTSLPTLRSLPITAHQRPSLRHPARQLKTRAFEYATSSDPPTGGGGPSGPSGGGAGFEFDVRQGVEAETWPGFTLRSPKQLVQYLDQYVIGQERAKKILAVAVFNHYNRVRANLSSSFDGEADDAFFSPSELNTSGMPGVPGTGTPFASPLLYPHLQPRRPYIQQRVPQPTFDKSNVLVIGPTGTGKTLLARTLARVLDVPFAMSDATTFTQAGYVGEDVESCIQRLLQAANWDVNRARVGIVCIDECDKIARRLSDGNSKDVSGEGVQQALLRMLEGSLVTVSSGGSATSHSPPPPGAASDLSPGNPAVGRVGRRTREGLPGHANKAENYQIDTSNILFILSGAFVGLDKVVRQRVAKGSIGFDAPLTRGSHDGKETKVSKEEVGKQFIPFFTPNDEANEFDLMDLVEPSDLVKYGFIPEFISRLPVLATLQHLPPRLLLRVLTEVRNSLVSQYAALFSYSGAEMRFTSEALWEVALAAEKKGTGARALRGIMENVLLEAMYDVPGSSVRYVLITPAVVRSERQAFYWSRGEGNLFWSALAEEEMKWAEGRGKEFIEEDTAASSASEQGQEESESIKPLRAAAGGSNIP
ncbi:ClpX ATPase regulatory subunit [Dacryopinax primogenitus]|uniref:ClpX ATPase regulatory subunit n=1 Tax=Dacryopinax primogenitus (strain DJM 731) TaxID=1858805 RepID=M5FR96_DACPD|nr:ClpX ATPase regulatory subunit [Dacryopinax primogenitus]EJT97444.1 ClpX ATPase regulatory subunit [Dacryopinax primogenitus]